MSPALRAMKVRHPASFETRERDARDPVPQPIGRFGSGGRNAIGAPMVSR